MVCAGGCNSVFCIYFNHLFKYQRKIYRGCGGTFGWTDVPFPVTERSGDDGRCDNRFDQLLDLHYIQSRHLLFKYDFGGDSWYNAYTLFNTFGGAMQILAMMLFFPILRKFLGTIQVFYTSFVMAILGYAVLLILMFVNMSNLYLLFVPAFLSFQQMECYPFSQRYSLRIRSITESGRITEGMRA